jgi:hypothetical protein
MTDEKMNLEALIEKRPDADFLREMIGFAAERLMELEVSGLTGAGNGERSVDRITSAPATATERPLPGIHAHAKQQLRFGASAMIRRSGGQSIRGRSEPTSSWRGRGQAT